MKKIISLILVVTLWACVLMPAYADEMTADKMFLDMPDNWATEALTAAVENGLIGGDGGYIKPDDFMTRAEMAAIMVRAANATAEADISAYSDVSKADWYYSAMSKAVAMGAFTGSDGKLNPESYITRQEAFVVLSRVFGVNAVPSEDTSAINAFSDKDSIADWARTDVSRIVEAGYAGGSDGMLNPLNNITRAEFAVVMNRLVKYYIDEPGEFTPSSDGNVMIRCGGVVIKDLTTDKMICIGDIEKEAAVKFSNCNISGEVMQRGGTVSFTDGGEYNALKAITKSAVLDITGLSADALQKLIDVKGLCVINAEVIIPFTGSVAN